MKGADGLLRVRRFRISETSKVPFFKSSVTAVACSPLVNSNLFLCPLTEWSKASNLGDISFEASSFSKFAVIVQYSIAWKAEISRSRSTTSLWATDWTLPADSPRLTFPQRTGLRRYPTSRSNIRRAC